MLKARWNNSLLELVSCRCVFFLRHGYMNAEKKIVTARLFAMSWCVLKRHGHLFVCPVMHRGSTYRGLSRQLISETRLAGVSIHDG